MKKTGFVTMVLLAAAALAIIGIQYSQAAKDKLIAPPKVGVVSVKEVFEKCAMKTAIEKELTDHGDKRFAELKKLEEEINIDRMAMSKRKENSDDYLDLMQSLILKQAQLDAQKEFYQQEITVKEMQGKEKIYRKILEVITSIAKEKGFDIILSRDDNYLSGPDNSAPAQSPTELVLTTKTHKLLYFNPDLDLTAEVLVSMDKANPQLKN
ncbi:MAG: OmpH family outer membrane protein [Phycisphaerae bacterium]|nr:OmpH family outer membrane protein [Phycisphaerae bacterium]